MRRSHAIKKKHAFLDRMIVLVPPPTTMTATMLTAHYALTCTASTMTGVLLSLSSSPSLTTLTLTQLSGVSTPSTIRGSRAIRVPRLLALSPVHVTRTLGPSTRSW